MALEQVLQDLQNQISELKYQLEGLRKIEKGIDSGEGFYLPLRFSGIRALYPQFGPTVIDTGSVISDVAPNHANLTPNAGVYDTKGTPGYLPYYWFNGTTAYAYRALSNAINPTNYFSVGLWLNFDDVSANRGLWRIGSTTVSSTLNYFTSGYFEFGWWDTGGTYRVLTTLTPSIPIGGWKFVSCTISYVSSVNNWAEIRVNDETRKISNNPLLTSVARTGVGNFEVGRGATTPNYHKGLIGTLFMCGNRVNSTYLPTNSDEGYIYFQKTRGYFGV